MKKKLGIITISVVIFSLNPTLTHTTPVTDREVGYNEQVKDMKNIHTVLNSKSYNIKAYRPITRATSKDNLSPSVTLPDNNSEILILVNKSNHLSKNYEPKDLRKVNSSSALEKAQLRDEAATALETMFKDAKKDGHDLFTRTGYRSYQTQENIFNNNVRKYGKEHAETFSANPGSSEHQAGLAVDLSSKGTNYILTQNFATLPEGKWVSNNSWKYGFIIRYPENKTHITKYIYEPWHIRYVGKSAAKDIYESDITFEEYLDK